MRGKIICTETKEDIERSIWLVEQAIKDIDDEFD